MPARKSGPKPGRLAPSCKSSSAALDTSSQAGQAEVPKGPGHACATLGDMHRRARPCLHSVSSVCCLAARCLGRVIGVCIRTYSSAERPLHDAARGNVSARRRARLTSPREAKERLIDSYLYTSYTSYSAKSRWAGSTNLVASHRRRGAARRHHSAQCPLADSHSRRTWFHGPIQAAAAFVCAYVDTLQRKDGAGPRFAESKNLGKSQVDKPRAGGAGVASPCVG